MADNKLQIKQEIRKALANKNLGGALGRFADDYLPARENVFKGRDFLKLREEIKQVKGKTINNMEELAEKFMTNAAKRGAKVFRAKNAEEACRYVLDLAQKNGVDLVVKSKSMASEEIHLNKHLEEAGIKAAETDLGEWIMQLCGQKPSHMVMPAIHLTKEEVAEIFSHEIEERLKSDIPRLVKVAREQLRQKFLSAGMGISGANVAVAETGTIFIMTNEGNARLVTTLPPIHVAVVGMEKLVEKMSDAGPIFEALPRCATAQHLTSYLTMITGPAYTEDINGETKIKELHIVLLDNGRASLAGNPDFNETLRCIRCASCLNVCPVFQLVGGHVFGHIYTGGIGTILTAFFGEGRNVDDLQALCLGCQRCKEYCPAGIDIPEMILKLRERYSGGRTVPRSQKFLMEKVMPNRKIFHTLLKTASKAQKPFTKGQPLVRHLPLFLSGLTDGRSLPALAEKPLRETIKQEFTTGIIQEKDKEKRVGFFAGCLIDFVYPEIGDAVIKTLLAMGYTPVFPLEQNCCGFPAEHSGFKETALKLAKQNIQAFEKANVNYIITACPTCEVSLKKSFVKLLAGDPEWSSKAKALAEKVCDYSSFVLKSIDNIKFKNHKLGTVTYHDSCHLKRSLGVYQEPRALLKKVGAQLIEMAWADRCCGFGGSYSIQFPELTKPITKQKIEYITDSGADIVAMDCPGCLMQIRGALDYYGKKTAAQHTAELVVQSLKNN